MGRKSKGKKRRRAEQATPRGAGESQARSPRDERPGADVRPAGAPVAPRWGMIGAIAALAALSYANAIDNPFVYDDFRTVVKNETIRDLSAIGTVLGHDRFRPLVNLSYAVDHAIWGAAPHGYHLTNLALHLLNVLLLLLVSRRLLAGSPAPPTAAPADDRRPVTPGGAEGWALLVAGLYAVHPMMTEGVGYVTGRSEVLCASFLLAGLLCFLRATATADGGWRWPAAGLLLWLLSVATKEVGAALPFLLLAHLFVAFEGEARRARRGLLWLYLGLVALTLVGGTVRVLSYLTAETSWTQDVLLHNLLTQGRVIWRYAQLLVLPVGQSVTHRVAEGDPLALRGALAGALLVGLAGLAWWRRRQAPLLALGSLWFLLALAPTTLVPLNEAMAEHRVYGAAPGFFLLLAALLRRGFGRLTARVGAQGARTAGRALAAGLLLLLAGLTFARNRVWDDPVTLWQNAVDRAPGVYAPLRSLADSYRLTKRCDQAVPVYRKALAIAPDSHDARNLLGACLVSIGQPAQAKQEFERVIAGHPTNLEALNNLGMLSVLRGQKAAARGYFERALMVDPKDRTALEGLKIVGAPR